MSVPSVTSSPVTVSNNVKITLVSAKNCKCPKLLNNQTHIKLNTILHHTPSIKISDYGFVKTGFISWASITVTVWEPQMLQAATVHVVRCDNPRSCTRDPRCAGNVVCTDVLIHTCWEILQCGTMLSLLKLSIASLTTNAGAPFVILRWEVQWGWHGGGYFLSTSGGLTALFYWDKESWKLSISL